MVGKLPPSISRKVIRDHEVKKSYFGLSLKELHANLAKASFDPHLIAPWVASLPMSSLAPSDRRAAKMSRRMPIAW